MAFQGQACAVWKGKGVLDLFRSQLEKLDLKVEEGELKEAVSIKREGEVVRLIRTTHTYRTQRCLKLTQELLLLET